MSDLTWEDLDVTDYTSYKGKNGDTHKVVVHEALLVLSNETPAEVVDEINDAVLLILASETPPSSPEEIEVECTRDGLILVWNTPVTEEVKEAERAEARKRIEDQIARLTKQLEEYK